MIKIRQNVFETNSSSSHSLVVCNKEIWSDFVAGKLFYNVLHKSNGYPVFCTWKDVKHFIKHQIQYAPYPDNWREMDHQKLKEYIRLKTDHELGYFQETFYSIDELEGYEYNEEKQEANLDYYFG